MKQLLVPFIFIFTVSMTVNASADTSKTGKIDGKEEFQKHCAACHENGGNAMKPEKTLKKKDMRANGVTSPGDIVRLMRKPGPGMTKFDRQTIDDKKARVIAEYILKTFK